MARAKTKDRLDKCLELNRKIAELQKERDILIAEELVSTGEPYENFEQRYGIRFKEDKAR